MSTFILQEDILH